MQQIKRGTLCKKWYLISALTTKEILLRLDYLLLQKLKIWKNHKDIHPIFKNNIFGVKIKNLKKSFLLHLII